ncbi:MAG: SDR family NAD(P)-dependent oxidoreductase, partial [Ignavibacteria bacterium]
MPGKNVLLIGASGGLGKHFALGLAKSGYDLALHYHDGLQNIKILQEQLDGFEITFKSYKADITSENEIKNLVENVNKDFGSLDILINNAGISLDGVSWKLGLDEWNRVLAVNLTGP